VKQMWPRKVSSLWVSLAGHGQRTARRLHWARIAAKGGLPHPGGERGIQGRRSRVMRRLPLRRGSFPRVPAAQPHPLRWFLLPARECLLPGEGRDARCLGRLLRCVAHGERFAFDRLYPSLLQYAHVREKVPQAVNGLDLLGGGEPFGGYSSLGALYVLAPKELSPLAEELHAFVSSLSYVLASASSPGPRLCAARDITRSATALIGR
jgi:hypothetical protein